MKQIALAIMLLLGLAVAADVAIVVRIHVDPLALGSLLAATTLILGAFLALTDGGCIRALRHWAGKSRVSAISLPLLLLVPYLIFAAGTRTFSFVSLFKLGAYVLAPTSILLPDRHRRRQSANLRDWLAMAAMAVPIPAHWLSNVWNWPQDLYFLLPLTSVCSGVYGFVVVRNLEDVGYQILWRKADVATGVAYWAAFSILAIPLGYALHFIHFHTQAVSWGTLGFQFVGIYLTIAIPEEVFFRGILQNLLEKTIRIGPPGLYALLIASAIFGASHFHHPPVPNWRYCIMATLAGSFYGMAFRRRRRISASALTHALVDTLWHFWF